MTAYGGLLTFTVSFEEAFPGISASLAAADVRLEGSNMSLTHTAFSAPQPGQYTDMEVQLLEVRRVSNLMILVTIVMRDSAY